MDGSIKSLDAVQVADDAGAANNLVDIGNNALEPNANIENVHAIIGKHWL